MKESCNPEDIDWSKAPLEEVLNAADQGIASARKEIKVRFKINDKDK